MIDYFTRKNNYDQKKKKVVGIELFIEVQNVQRFIENLTVCNHDFFIICLIYVITYK